MTDIRKLATEIEGLQEVGATEDNIELIAKTLDNVRREALEERDAEVAALREGLARAEQAGDILQIVAAYRAVRREALAQTGDDDD